MATMLSHASTGSDWCRISRPMSAASTGLTLMKMPKNPAGTRRNASRSARSGTAEDKIPAAAAHASAATVGGCRSSTTIPIGTKTSADSAAAAAEPSAPGRRRPISRLSRM
jgi:hypothetical protein